MIGLGVAAFNVLAAGHIRSDAEEERRRQTGEKGRMLTQSTWERTEDEKKMCTALEKVAKEVGTEHITAVAIAYVMQKMPYVFPIIGGRKVEHLMANIEALKISLTEEQIKYIEGILPFELGFPNQFIVSRGSASHQCSMTYKSGQGDGTSKSFALGVAGHEDRVTPLQAIKPSPK